VPIVAFKEESAATSGTVGQLLAYRALDVSIALVVLVLTAPLLLALCVLIRLDSSGPAIFRQRRLGRHRRPFTVHKLRTMRVQCDEGIHRAYVEQLLCGEELTHAGEDGNDLYKLAADDRVTRVGRVLRKTSLDELPQILDVLRGHMSIVGPRPVIPYEAELYPPEYERRFEVKPGITGLWQVNGRNERTYREMVELDIAWARDHSLGLYLSILLRTPLVLLARRGVA
jgi:lipopolysaccharide/colanic/teichoic acid biosynthesis glycosyltransferase